MIFFPVFPMKKVGVTIEEIVTDAIILIPTVTTTVCSMIVFVVSGMMGWVGGIYTLSFLLMLNMPVLAMYIIWIKAFLLTLKKAWWSKLINGVFILLFALFPAICFKRAIEDVRFEYVTEIFSGIYALNIVTILVLCFVFRKEIIEHKKDVLKDFSS